MLISIIIPVYKVEEYIDKCIKSILNQTYSNIEVILIDDGSPDNCPQICDNYALKDERIKVIHKINGGLSDARNAGLHFANGEYVLFVDSDDYVEIDACEQFINCLNNENPDIITGSAIQIKYGNKIIKMNYKKNCTNKIISGEEYLLMRMQDEILNMAVWLNLYRRQFLINNNLFFVKGRLHEDEQWTPRVLLKAKKVKETNICFYNYMIRNDSITQVKDKTKNAIDQIQTVNELTKIYTSLENKTLRELLMDYLVMLYLNAFYVGRLYRHEYKCYINKPFINNNANSKHNKRKALLFYISPYLYWHINHLLKKRKV